MANTTIFGQDTNKNLAQKSICAPVGEIFFFAKSTPPEHALVCNGAELSISAYPELYDVIGTKYGGNGSTTFRLPKAEGVIYAAGANHAVGEVIAEGLPDISGTFISLTASATGAFISGDVTEYNCAAGGHAFYQKSFHASAANAIYGASAHVTPAGIALLACIVYE
jgi:microcystin-dependent protein